MAEQPTTVANYLMTNVAEALRLVVLTALSANMKAAMKKIFRST